MAHRIVMLLGLSLVCLSLGCATSTTGEYQRITVTSEPRGAKIRTTNGLFLIAPGILYFHPDEDYVLVAEYPGCELQQQELNHEHLAQPRVSTLLGRIIRDDVYVDSESGGSTLLSRIIRGDFNPPSEPHGALTPNRVHFDFSQSGQVDTHL